MKTLFFCAAAALSLALLTPTGPVEAKGCLKGAVVGGTAGHFAGHHGVAGAAIGCAVGHHEAKKHEREKLQSQSNPAR